MLSSARLTGVLSAVEPVVRHGLTSPTWTVPIEWSADWLAPPPPCCEAVGLLLADCSLELPSSPATVTGAFACTDPVDSDGLTSPTWTVPTEWSADWLAPPPPCCEAVGPLLVDCWFDPPLLPATVTGAFA